METKVYLVKAGYDYEGDDVIFVGSTREKAQAYIDETFEKKLYETRYHTKEKWYGKDPHCVLGHFDSLEIEEMTIDVGKH